jgi:hypothetical protein
VTIDLAATPDAPTVAVGDSGSVSLGYDDSSIDLVFTGPVNSVRYGIHGVTRIIAANGGATLSRLRVNQSYERQNAGAIVQDLLGRASVDTDHVEDGTDYPFYVVDDRQGAYAHVAALARRSGFLSYFTPAGKLNFAPFADGDPIQTFTYGSDILALDVTDATPVFDKVTAAGDGAAGSHGSDAWSWPVKDLSSVQADNGSGDQSRRVDDGSLRSADAVRQTAASIVAAAGQLTLTGRLVVPGTPTAVVGATVAIAKAPRDSLNGTFVVRRVQHNLTKSRGFLTTITFSQVASASSGAGLPSTLGALP